MQMSTDADSNLSAEEKFKVQNVELKVTVLRLQERLLTSETELNRLKKNYKDLSDDKLRGDAKFEARIEQYNTEIRENKEENEKLQNRIKDLEEEIDETIGHYNKEIEKIITSNKAEIHSLNQKLEDLQGKYDKVESFVAVEALLRSELATTSANLDQEKKDRRNEVNEKEREKIQVTEKLRKDMLYKIKETKANLLALNDEQLQTTTRLTILQNHQLTTELEYQSKQTEQLLFKNNKMKAQIETLKRDIEIHKEVEKELAKRSHFCQKVIKRLKQQVKDLEQEKTDSLTKRGPITGGQAHLGQLKGIRNSIGSPKRKDPLLDDSKGNDDLINYLEQKLEEIEKKLSNTQNEYESLQTDYIELQDKMNLSREKYKRAALLLTDFLDDLLTSTPNVLQSDKDMHLNLDKIKETPVEDLEKEDKIALVLVLLKQLQPYLSANNLSVAPPKQFAPKPVLTKRIGFQQQEGHPGGGASGTGEVEALNRILNNINVQTKKNELEGKLPPIKK